MNSHRIIRALIGALVLVAALAVISCDERNEADIPPVVYTLKHNIVTAGVAQYVSLQEDLLAVAATRAGTYVYNVSNPNSPEEVFHFTPPGELYSIFAAIDAVNGLVFTVAEPDVAFGDKYPIHDLATGERIGGATFSGGSQEVALVTSDGEFTAWRTDQSAGDGLAGSSYCFNADSGQWLPTYCTFFNNSYIPAFSKLRGFDVNDSLFVIAHNNYEVRIFNSLTGHLSQPALTPGDPQDCAWYGDYILIADNFYLTVLNASEIDTPVVVKSMAIPGADRLQRIVVDGDHAVILDDADGLYVVNVADPMNPVLEQTISLPEPTYVTAYNGTMVASDEQLGVLIYQR